MKAMLIEVTISYDHVFFRASSGANGLLWECLAFGCWPDSDRPSHRWVNVAEQSVPDDVIKLAREKL